MEYVFQLLVARFYRCAILKPLLMLSAIQPTPRPPKNTLCRVSRKLDVRKCQFSHKTIAIESNTHRRDLASSKPWWMLWHGCSIGTVVFKCRWPFLQESILRKLLEAPNCVNFIRIDLAIGHQAWLSANRAAIGLYSKLPTLKDGNERQTKQRDDGVREPVKEFAAEWVFLHPDLVIPNLLLRSWITKCSRSIYRLSNQPIFNECIPNQHSLYFGMMSTSGVNSALVKFDVGCKSIA